MKLPKYILINTASTVEEALSQIQIASEAGAPWVQLRLKHSPKDQIRAAALAAQKNAGPNTLLCLNDHPDLVLATKIPCVHLGKNDLHPLRARNLLGPKTLIGCTVNSIEDAQRLAKYAQHIDYFGVGPWRFTGTKENLAPILSPEDFREICKILPRPCYAIGGIKPEDWPLAQELGLYGLAIAGDVFDHPSPQSRISVWNQLFEPPPCE